LTASLAAYLISLDPIAYTVATLKAKIIDMQWTPNPELPYVPPAIWNGENAGLCPVSKRDDGSIRKRDCSGGSATIGLGPPITFTSGAASPTCTGSGCGTYCSSGPYCSAPCEGTCGGDNPDFEDPANPDSPQHTTSSTTTTTSLAASTTISLNAASCSGTGAASIPKATASAVVSEFCGAEGGKTITSDGVSLTYTDVDSDDDTAVLHITALGTSENEACKDFELDATTCETIFDAIIDSCSTTQGKYYGGVFSQGCWEYTF
jgi:hypothetical protein